MLILSINAGSSSLKFTGYQMPEEKVLISGLFERIGINNSIYTIKIKGEKIKKEFDLPNHEVAIKKLLEELLNYQVINKYEDIKAVGHRVVHGGEKYTDSVIIDDDVITTIKELSSLAPLHNPANLIGIKVFKDILPNVTNVAIFDTAFHQTMPPFSYIYPVPYEWYQKYQIRKYGFHGTSHKYIYEEISKQLNRNDLKVISCHLGNGGSITAIDSGKVLDTTLGFTPLPGVMMGTRCGDIDPSIIPYIMEKENKSIEEVMNDLNKQSGLLGVSQLSSDSRDIEEGVNKNNEQCVLAEEMYERKIVNYISQYYCLLNKPDVICFAGGIGENGIHVRKNIIEKLKVFGINVDEEKNDVRGKFTKISTSNSSVDCFVVPTDEEVMIARDTYQLVK
ncbi:MAG: acetate kinase [bacterium]|nr:acetate kinase [bacterium]